ncbi:MAG: TIM barrel protein [bacterium]
MRLGGPVKKTEDASAWVQAHIEAGYDAAYWPNPPVEQEAEYMSAAASAGIMIAEVGAWSNPLNPDSAEREKAIRFCIDQLATADRIGARCCVNIAGSLGAKWDGPAPDDLKERAFAQIVRTVRRIIDAVQPTRTYYTLETMPWMYPHSVKSYLRLLEAIDRDRFAVHLDVVNLINCPSRYFHNSMLIHDAVAALGAKIRSCHAKDTLMSDRFTVHIDEVAPGKGTLDYATLLRELSLLDDDIPIMLEHLPAEEYPRAAAYIREVAESEGITLG